MDKISKIKVNGTEYAIEGSPASGSVESALGIDSTSTDGTFLRKDGSWATPTDTNTTYKLTINGTTNGDSTNGTSLGTLYAPITAPSAHLIMQVNANGVPEWKDYLSSFYLRYNAVNMTVTHSNLNFEIPSGLDYYYLYCFDLNVNITSFTWHTLPHIGSSIHIIFKSSSQKTITLPLITTGSIRLIWPDGVAPATVTVPTNGYVELDILRGTDTTENNETISWLYCRMV